MKKKLLAGIMALCLVGGTNVLEFSSSFNANASREIEPDVDIVDDIPQETTGTDEIEIINSGKWGKSGTWTLDVDGLLTISGTGSFPGLKDKLTSDEVSKVEGVKIEEGITNIGTDAFKGYANLGYIELPETVTAIGENAFYECKSLYDVQLPDSLQTIGAWAFYNCSSLTSIVIPDNVTTIVGYVFKSSGLTEITLGKGIKYIKDYAFDYTHIGSIIYRGNEKSWKSISFETRGNDVLIDNPENITYLVKSGDANGDGETSIADAVLIMQALSNSDEYSLSDIGEINADVLDNDGVSSADALVIQMVVANTITSDVLPLTSEELAELTTTAEE